MLMEHFNQLITADAVMWAAAGVSLALLLLAGSAATIAASTRRDTGMRLMKVFLYVLLIVVVLLPFLILVTGERVAGLPCALYLLCFPLFGYFFGRKLGFWAGERNMNDAIGLDLCDNLADAQDRLYESRLRFPSPHEVSRSIVELSKKPGDAPAKTGDASAKPPEAPAAVGSGPGAEHSKILDVEVEEI